MNYNNIPDELKKYNNWICWRAVPQPKADDPNHIGKIPVNPITGGNAQSTNPATWCDFKTALDRSADFSGIGFVFTNSPFFGVDLDGKEKEIAEFKSGNTDGIIGEFIHTLGSYTELSQSGKGIHIICRGTLPEGGRRNKETDVEMYETGRFFALTGDIFGDYRSISDGTEAIKALHEKYIGGGSRPLPRNAPVTDVSELKGNIPALIEKARQSRQGALFSDLMAGNWQGHFNSQSEADLSFCNMLAFWLGRDKDAIDSVYRSSGLMRPKWDRKQSGSTYGAITVEKAVSECGTVYGEKSSYSEYSISISSSGEITSAENRDGEEIKLYPMDDTGNAQRLCDNYGERLRYCYQTDKWYYWDLRRWCVDITGTIDRVADEALEIMASEAELYKAADERLEAEEGKKGKMYQTFLKHLKVSRSSKSKTAAKKELRHKLPVVMNSFDCNKFYLNTPDGIIDFKNNTVLPHDPEKFITKLTGTGLSDKECPQWLSFLNTVFKGDRDIIRYIQKAVGYSLTGSTSEQCVFFLYGNGRNGKSTFLDIIRAMMGDYACNAQPETLMVSSKNAGGARSDIARLKGSRIVTTVEPNEGMRLDEGLLKQLTGGDPVTARFQYSSDIEFFPEFKIWMATNHKPIIRGTDVGIWRRIHLIPFTNEIPEDKVDRSLPYKLRRELPSILKWAVSGYSLYKSEGLRKPAAVEKAVGDYRREMDVISSFISACCTVGTGCEQSSVLYAVYCKWAGENNEYKMSHTKFTSELIKRTDIRKEHTRNGALFHGISVREYFEPDI